MTKTVSAMKEWQKLIAGISLALSIAYATVYAGGAILRLSYSVGQAIEQHNQILRLIEAKCGQ